MWESAQSDTGSRIFGLCCVAVAPLVVAVARLVPDSRQLS